MMEESTLKKKSLKESFTIYLLFIFFSLSLDISSSEN